METTCFSSSSPLMSAIMAELPASLIMVRYYTTSALLYNVHLRPLHALPLDQNFHAPGSIHPGSDVCPVWLEFIGCGFGRFLISVLAMVSGQPNLSLVGRKYNAYTDGKKFSTLNL